ncbi:Eco57I restriction-modification methylase domain-containing protein [Halorubrum ezzemoulense]|uniref:site-specific DNA-methyltransferase (adenine-specific) n=1 Tax=Halorubrum ezzemoulense TaxID=337243 RepID=A0A256JUM6_HALEZ|nr:DNA methyltransferase [Halorubrum ezzemoulense]OYR72599.1 type II restriction endonuclease subunit M [Halorubrum ezzemoulense]
MSVQQITAKDIAGWDSLQDIADSFAKRGLKPRSNLGGDNELVLQLDDDEFVVLVNAGPGETATDFKPDNRSRHTNLVATNDFEEFTFLTRMRSWEGQQHGRIKHQKISFTKEQFTSDSGEKNTVLKKLNSIEYGSSAAIYDTLYDTQQVVEKFYEEFEELRTNLVQEVSGIPDDRGDAKRRYVQVILDRMIFLYFIQEKRLLDRNPNYLHEQPGDVVDDGEDRYENFYRPLFFDYLAEDKQNPDFGSLPYLNGGLFAKNPVEEEFPEAKLGGSTEETNELFDDVLEFLSGWNWNVDERLDIVDPKNLSPAILGHIFEQTVNQKEMGAYYTPEEITGFMSRGTVHPYLLDQLNDAVDTEYDEIDDVFGFPGVEASSGEQAVADGGTMARQVPTENVETNHVETLYHDILKEAHILDPAVGSGAFLLAVQDVLVDIYIQCIEYFQQLGQEGKGWELDSRTRDELEEINEGQGGASLYAKRTVILKNLYGVDIDEGAVEICKLRLWLSMVADIEDEPNEVEPLPNIDFNIRQGNSLIGFTDVHEIANDQGDASLTNYGGGIGESVEELYDDVIKPVKRHRQAESSAEAANARKIAESRIQEHGEKLDDKILAQFQEAGVDDITIDEVREYSPFHWVLEFASVYADGGFDVLIGNPPWDQLRASRDDFFPQYDERFRTRPPSEKDKIEEELLEQEAVSEAWQEYQDDIETQMRFFTDGPEYQLQTPVVAGRKDPNENNLAGLFVERVFDLVKEDGYVAQVLPGVIFNGSFSKDLRMKMLDEASIESLVEFENKGIFEGIDDRYQFGVVTFKNSGRTESLRGIFNQSDLAILQNLDEVAVDIPRTVLSEYSPEARIFPFLTNQAETDILHKIFQHPSLGEDIADTWKAIPCRELDRARASDRFVESEEEGDYPVYGGRNIYQFIYDSSLEVDVQPPKFFSVEEEKNPDASAKRRVRERNFNSGNLKKAIYDEFGGKGSSKSQKAFVNDLLNETRGEELHMGDVLLDCTEYRIGYREIARSTDERTMIAAVLPKGVICHHKVHTLHPYEIVPTKESLSDNPLHSAYQRIFTDEELFAVVGLLNSIPFDFLMRTKIDTSIVQYKFKESQVPRLTGGDDWFQYISERAAKLNCYGEEFAEMRERLGGLDPAVDKDVRSELQAEIDAAACHAYGLERREVQFILDDFHRVKDPRVMTGEYFEVVLEKYDDLMAKGPLK